MNYNWPTKKLGELISFEKGKKMSVSDTGDPYIGIENLRSGTYSIYTKEKNGIRCVQDDVLLVWDGAYAGTVGIGLEGFVGSTIVKVLHDDSLDNSFLFYLLNLCRSKIRSAAQGAAIPHLSKTFVNNLIIPLPPLEIQKQIVERLDKIAEAQKLNGELIQKDDELFQSLLHKELDPTGKNWKVKKLPEVAKLERGRFTPRPRNDPQYFGGSIPWIQTGDIVNSNGLITTYSQTLNEKGLKVSKIFLKGTIVITIAANIGDLAILGINSAFPDSVVGICADEKIVDSSFLYFQLTLAKDYLNAQATQAAQKNINLAVLSKVNIFLPTMDIQKQIVEKLSAAQEYKNQLLAQKGKFKELFDSVLHKSMTPRR